ncbi:MAG: UDP-N-acetylmuramoyl-tripeptide--D-alanyl-D-alanine ligase [Lachnospiraceae bacterium]|nr:UDP-N-acetylmuramoyl-tripeptide--D-alanyl-D-alanine ligase [Lachnospiraceae bacterium]
MKAITVSDILIATKGTLIRGNKTQRITDVCIDSKSIPSEATLFIPLKGERVDAHKFIDNAIENGAIGCIVSDLLKVPENVQIVIEVADTKKALQDIGAYYRKTRDIKLVGVTGSVGKTTTRELTAAALMAIGRENVYQTLGNRNSQTGVPLTLCDIADEKLGVIELGISEEGEMDILTEMAELDAAIITVIGVAHIQQLKSQENICREKMAITKGLKADGCILINGDDQFQRDYRSKLNHKSYLYGTAEDCDFRATDIKQQADGMSFNFHAEGKVYEAYIPIMGMHNVVNATAALGAACVLGVDVNEAIKSIADFKGVKMRQQILEKNGFTVIDDSYNANPDSMKAGLKVLADYELKTCGRKIALLADMKELGDDEVHYHEEIGGFAAGMPIDMLLTVGTLAESIGKICRTKNKSIITIHFDDNAQASEYLNTKLKAGDILYVKGSRSMALDEVVKALK